MNFSFLIPALAAVPPLASYPFTVAFLLLLVARLVQWQLSDPAGAANLTFGLAQAAGTWISDVSLPLWLTSWYVLAPLGILMLVEWAAENNSNAQAFLSDANRLIKPAGAFAVQFGLVDGQSRQIVRIIAETVPPDWHAWLSGGSAVASLQLQTAPPADELSWLAHGLAALWAFLAAGAVWLLTAIRSAVISAILDIDENDDLGLMRLFTLADGGWTIVSVVVLVLAPLLALLLAGITLLVLLAVQKWLERREQQTLVACHNCGRSISPAAPTCFNCRQVQRDPVAVGVFGQPTRRPAGDPATHRLNLLARKRCPTCAARLTHRSTDQTCTACGTPVFGDLATAQAFRQAVDRRLPITLGVCLLLGLIPLVGLIPGIVYYRLSLINSLRAYLPGHVGCTTRWVLRIASVILIALQPFPGVGAITLPLLCLLTYAIYRQAFEQTAKGNLPVGAAA
jgi:hypothetical protein